MIVYPYVDVGQDCLNRICFLPAGTVQAMSRKSKAALEHSYSRIFRSNHSRKVTQQVEWNSESLGQDYMAKKATKVAIASFRPTSSHQLIETRVPNHI